MPRSRAAKSDWLISPVTWERWPWPYSKRLKVAVLHSGLSQCLLFVESTCISLKGNRFGGGKASCWGGRYECCEYGFMFLVMISGLRRTLLEEAAWSWIEKKKEKMRVGEAKLGFLSVCQFSSLCSCTALRQCSAKQLCGFAHLPHQANRN